MFIDYLTLMLVNMAAGLVILADFVFRGLHTDDQKRWVPGFAAAGLVGLATGLHMIWTWPLPGPYNSAFGEMTVLLSVLFLGAALAIAKGWGFDALAIYAFFAGAAAIVLGARIIDLKMTQKPLLTGIGFILTGAAGVCVCPALRLRKCPVFRSVAALVLVAAGGIWAWTAGHGLWGHMAGFAKWLPATMKP